MADEAGLAELQRLGARSVPVVSRGDKFVFAQVIKDVVDFLELDDDTKPKLSPAELKARYDGILVKAIALVRVMPDAHLDKLLPGRPRSWRVLLHHIFQIPVAFLDMEETGEALSYENMVAPPPDEMVTSDAIADFGEQVRQRFNGWAAATDGADFSGDVPTYFGGTTRHEMLERTVWHSTQHVRQLAALLDDVSVVPPSGAALAEADFDQLPLPQKLWG